MNSIADFSALENLLLPPGSQFSDDARAVINCWESKDILACPGSGKTTVLLAKLKLLSDRLPFPDGCGICVLSHTNVAVNELKNKLGDSSNLLLSYPNFVGTIQVFINQFILFPFLRDKVASPICLVSNEEYAKYLHILIRNEYKKIDKLLNAHFRYRNNRFTSISELIENIYVDEHGLKIKNERNYIAGRDNDAFREYLKATQDLLFTKGILRYDDTYKHVKYIFDQYGDLLKNIISKRFSFVFVDEYQDCSRVQKEILDSLFSNTDTIFQKIGDIDQAIYNNAYAEDSLWNTAHNHLEIACSNRYGQEIADILTFFRSKQPPIIATRGNIDIPPTLFVYTEESRHQVIQKFIDKIKYYNLEREGGVFKAIGIFHNVKGLKIRDYWDKFENKKNAAPESNYHYFLTNIVEALDSGNIFLAENYVRKLLCKIFHILDIKNSNNKYYTMESIKTYLYAQNPIDFRESILNLMRTTDSSYCGIKREIDEIISSFFGCNLFDQLPDSFIKGSYSNSCTTYGCEGSCIEIKFDTVYGVKGETHDATLYLETETRNSSDIIRVIKKIDALAKNKTLEDRNGLYERSSRCVYVGLSRPKNLLCLAIRKSTYDRYPSFFSKWHIEHI